MATSLLMVNGSSVRVPDRHCVMLRMEWLESFIRHLCCKLSGRAGLLFSQSAPKRTTSGCIGMLCGRGYPHGRYTRPVCGQCLLQENRTYACGYRIISAATTNRLPAHISRKTSRYLLVAVH